MVEQPSMDEILASIRRILSSDVEDAHEERPPVVELTEDMRVPPQAPVTEPVSRPVKPSAPVPPPAPMPVPEVHAPAPKSTAVPDDVTALELPEHVTFDDAEFFRQEPEQPVKPQPVVQEPTPKQEENLDSLLLGILRPLLREWLDKNMPRLLESCIQQELKKEHNDNPSSF